MAHEPTCFETLHARTLPREVMQLQDVDLALVWLDTSPFRDFEDLAYSDCVGLLVTFELRPGLPLDALDDWMGPDDVLQESWTGKGSTFGTARIALATCSRWLSQAGRRVVARFEAALMWRDQRGSPSADSVLGAVEATQTRWRADPSDATSVVNPPGQTHSPDDPPSPSSPWVADAASRTANDLWIVVDDGCPWARSDLRLPNGCSRLRSLWYQQAPGTPIEDSQALPHSWAGRYWDTTRMNDWLSRTGHDPAAAYAQWGDAQLLRRTSHGAHILGLLLGRAGERRPPHDVTLGPDSEALAFPDRPTQAATGPAGPDLVFVQLPSAVRSTVSRAALTPWVLEGIAHGLQHAAGVKRAVATLCLESYDGPHDGSSLFEAGVQALIEQARDRQQLDLRVVLAAGNAHQRQVAAYLDLVPGQSGELQWEAAPGCERAAWLELWCPADQPLPALQVAAPGHEPSQVLGAGDVWAWPSRDTAVCAVLVPAAPRAGGRLIWVRLAPTQVFQPGEPAAPCGIWRLRMTSAVPLRVHAYLARLWPGPGGKPAGRQGRLWGEAPQTSALDRPLPSPLPGSISGMACGGPDITVVGGSWGHALATPATPDAPNTPNSAETAETPTACANASGSTGLNASSVLNGPTESTEPRLPNDTTSMQSPVPYSGRGPARGGWRARAPAVDALAPSEESHALPGVRSTGHLDASTSRMGGTSVAVPLHARSCLDPQQPETPPP